MAKLAIFISLFTLYTGYSILVYTKGTENQIAFNGSEQALVSKGKIIYQEYNCTACHQLYGLGGFLGPDLTTAWSDKHRGEVLIRALLKTGSQRMPDFHLNDEQVNALTHYLRYVDSTATSYK